MPEFECFVSGSAGAIVEASNADEAKKLYYNLLMSELSAKDIVACAVNHPVLKGGAWKSSKKLG